jgi:hypothetical protein
MGGRTRYAVGAVRVTDKDSKTQDSKIQDSKQEDVVGVHDLVKPRARPSATRQQPQPPRVEGPADGLDTTAPANDDITLANQMTAIWNEVVEGTPLRQARLPRGAAAARALADVIRHDWFHHGNLTRWRRFCALAANDAQCRGELNGEDYPNWTATLAHAIRPRSCNGSATPKPNAASGSALIGCSGKSTSATDQSLSGSSRAREVWTTRRCAGPPKAGPN